MVLNKKQIETIILLDGPKRYSHFIKRIVDWEEVWGLYDDGWALASTDDGVHIFPLWPAQEYAALCANENWQGYNPEVIKLADFMDYLLPKLKEDGVLLGVFYTPTDKGITPSVDQLLSDLNEELANY